MKTIKRQTDQYISEQPVVTQLITILMNIFFLFLNQKECVKAHCDSHVIKMILETAQILCSVHWVFLEEFDHESNSTLFMDCDPYIPQYKLTHKNHPSSKWARKCVGNYKWLSKLGLELCKEYTFRYGKTHKTEKILKELYENIPHIPQLDEVRFEWEYEIKSTKSKTKTFTKRKMSLNTPLTKTNVLDEKTINSLKSQGITEPPQAMPDEYKDNNFLIAYRKYYKYGKERLHKWCGKINGRDIPDFINDDDY